MGVCQSYLSLPPNADVVGFNKGPGKIFVHGLFSKLSLADRLDVWCYTANALCRVTHDPPVRRRHNLRRLLARFVVTEAMTLLQDPSAGTQTGSRPCHMVNRKCENTPSPGDAIVAQCVRGVGHGGCKLATERTARGTVFDVLLVALQVGLQPGKKTAAALARLRQEMHPLADDGEVGLVLEDAVKELCNLSTAYPVVLH